MPWFGPATNMHSAASQMVLWFLALTDGIHSSRWSWHSELRSLCVVQKRYLTNSYLTTQSVSQSVGIVSVSLLTVTALLLALS